MQVLFLIIIKLIIYSFHLLPINEFSINLTNSKYRKQSRPAGLHISLWSKGTLILIPTSGSEKETQKLKKKRNIPGKSLININ